MDKCKPNIGLPKTNLKMSNTICTHPNIQQPETQIHKETNYIYLIRVAKESIFFTPAPRTPTKEPGKVLTKTLSVR